MSARPRIALTLGDPAGIGPEIVRACLRDPALRGGARLCVVGPEALRPRDVAPTTFGQLDQTDDVSWIATEAPETWVTGRPQASAGRAALAALRAGARLAARGAVDALVTAPVSKEALHAAGERVEGQTELLARWDGRPEVEMLAVADGLRVMPLTRHLPLREALDAIDSELVWQGLSRLHSGLTEFGFERPRLALAGWNPHAGEGGILGSEDGDLLAPAVERARSSGIDVSGPLPPDSVFPRAARGEFDAVLALYHDQAFIPVKLLAPTRGFTVLLGLSYVRMSPAHGTAFDIAGRGLADPTPLATTLAEAAVWGARYRSSRAARVARA